MKEHTVITISRQYGSGGKELSDILAKKLGTRCYDRQILYLAAQEIGAESVSIESVNQLAYEKGGIGTAGITGVMGIGNIPVYNQMFLEQAKVIQKLASQKTCVFLGRCADFVLKNLENHYSFFIYADDEFKEKRAKELYGNASVCIFRKNCASVPEERSAIPLQTEQSSAGLLFSIVYSAIPTQEIQDGMPWMSFGKQASA